VRLTAAILLAMLAQDDKPAPKIELKAA